MKLGGVMEKTHEWLRRIYRRLFGAYLLILETRTLVTSLTAKMENFMATVADLQALITKVGQDVGAALDALDVSISQEIQRAKDAILAGGGVDTQPAMDALNAMDTAVSNRVTATKAEVDAAFPAPTPPPPPPANP